MATETPVEGPYEKPESKPEDAWPSAGVISFNDVVLKYRPELDNVLRGLSFTTAAHERVGVVGRTGSGKSSALVALFRMVELEGGSICVDGHNVADIGLYDLRSRMAIVPQDPVLFDGTIRSNLDPLGKCDDARLWDALRRVHMADALREIGKRGAGEGEDEGVEMSGEGLDLAVRDRGGNFSAGERQLLSLARAILSGVKIVLLDEASASLDNTTDMLVQRTVREELRGRTVVTIAHRLATVVDCDRVMVVDGGRVVEMDTPRKLLEAGGWFARLVERSGPVESEVLRGMIHGRQ